MKKHCVHPFSIKNKNAFHHEVHHFCFQCRIGKCLRRASTVTHSHWGKWLGAFTWITLDPEKRRGKKCSCQTPKQYKYKVGLVVTDKCFGQQRCNHESVPPADAGGPRRRPAAAGRWHRHLAFGRGKISPRMGENNVFFPWRCSLICDYCQLSTSVFCFFFVFFYFISFCIFTIFIGFHQIASMPLKGRISRYFLWNWKTRPDKSKCIL